MPPIVPFEPINPTDELMEQFVSEYPTSVKQNQAYIEVAHFHFSQGIIRKHYNGLIK
jgi:Tfp pilus assembly protein PilO